MSKKSYLLQASEAVPEFKDISERFYRKYTIAMQSLWRKAGCLLELSGKTGATSVLIVREQGNELAIKMIHLL